jgi:hypothetical protein
MFLYRHPDDFYQLFGSAVILIAGPKKRDEAYYKLVQRSMKRSGHISERTVIRALERFMKDRIFPLCRRHRVAEPDIGGMMQ